MVNKIIGLSMFMFMMMAVVLCVDVADARTMELPLLAVKEGGGNMTGSIAKLYLTIEPGPGRLFLETFPLTKTDTQMSTRIAQKTACKLSDKDCSRYDFFYTISADSSIIGGPSASAANAVITYAALEKLHLKRNMSITGTIGSGNIIGAVGGVKEKIIAAGLNGINVVLIPRGTARSEVDNVTVDLVEIGKDYSVNVIEVATLEEAIYYFTGRNITQKEEPLQIAKSYTVIMERLASTLCDRGVGLLDIAVELEESKNISLWNDRNATLNLTSDGKIAYNNMQFYAAASYCFGSNVKWKTHIYELQNLSLEKSLSIVDALVEESNLMDAKLNEIPLDTITDLQTYMIVKERIREARETFDLILKVNYSEGNLSVSTAGLAYAEERLYSAVAWSHFFNNSGQLFDLDSENLKSSCVQKLSEADEMYQYIKLYLPESYVEGVRKVYDDAYMNYNIGDYPSCLFQASRSKAKANILLSSITTESDKLDELVDLKLRVAKKLIYDQEQKGMFPIVGYSYYEYANALKEGDSFSGLLYAEYSLELSNLDMYFSDTEENHIPFYINSTYMSIFIGGILVGVGLTMMFCIFLKSRSVKSKKLSKGKRRMKK